MPRCQSDRVLYSALVRFFHYAFLDLASDHPEFPARLTLSLETCLAFSWAGAGHAFCIAAIHGLAAGRTQSFDHYLNSMVLVFAALMSHAPVTASDYRVHHGQSPRRPQLLFFQALHFLGFVCARWWWHNRVSLFLRPLFYVTPQPPLVLLWSYRLFIFCCVWWSMTELLVVSPVHLVFQSGSRH